MNLPKDIQLLLSSGKSTLYTLPSKYSQDGVFLLAISREATFFIHQDGTIGRKAGKLDDLEVVDVVRFAQSVDSSPAQFKIAH